MKLELKYLAPYLPYRLSCYLQGYKDEYDRPIKETILGLYDETEVFVSLNKLDYETYIISDVFPILRPLSDLEYLIYNQEIKELKTQEDTLIYWSSRNYIDFDEMPFNDVKWLLKNHFDVFGLIEQCLAIDINTIEI